MVKINEVDPEILNEAILAWTGFETTPFPLREESALNGRFTANEVANLLPLIKSLEEDFYKSKAHLTAVDLQEMGSIAAADFKKLYPQLRYKIAEAFAWCYTFDYK